MSQAQRVTSCQDIKDVQQMLPTFKTRSDLQRSPLSQKLTSINSILFMYMPDKCFLAVFNKEAVATDLGKLIHGLLSICIPFYKELVDDLISPSAQTPPNGWPGAHLLKSLFKELSHLSAIWMAISELKEYKDLQLQRSVSHLHTVFTELPQAVAIIQHPDQMDAQAAKVLLRTWKDWDLTLMLEFNLGATAQDLKKYIRTNFAETSVHSMLFGVVAAQVRPSLTVFLNVLA